MATRPLPLFHHCTSLKTLLETESLIGHPDWSDADYHKAYTVWEKLFGFYPLFLAMGRGAKTIELTGYANQFGRVVSCRYDRRKKKRVRDRRPKGSSPNLVLLSFDHCAGVAHKFDTWEDVLCWAFNSGKCPKRYTDRLIQQAKRGLGSWVNSAKRKDGYVQICVPRLEPKTASRVWVRNQKTKKSLEARGYRNVEVRRLLAKKWWM